ncbi:MAG: helix-turn-helix domain-containing protein [Patescibacteria group bacterium]
MNIEGVLRKSGFSEKEAEVYLSLLKLGSSIVSDIAKKSGINRSTTYVILDALAKRGLVSITERRGVKVYNSISPEQLVQYLENNAKQFSELASTAKELLPKIKVETAKQRLETTPKVQLFEGEEGMRTVYEDALSSLETIRSYASKASDEETAPEKYYDRLVKKNIKVKMLFPETLAIQELTKGMRPAQLPAFSQDISVYDNKIVFMSPINKFALVIESKELADALKKAFDLSWEEAKRSKKPFGSGLALGSA